MCPPGLDDASQAQGGRFTRRHAHITAAAGAGPPPLLRFFFFFSSRCRAASALHLGAQVLPTGARWRTLNYTAHPHLNPYCRKGQ